MSKQIPNEPSCHGNAKPWNEIEDYYRKLFNGAHLEILQLIKHISKSNLSTKLFAYTSMDKLVISIYEKIDPMKEALHISFDLKTSKWVFAYYGGPLYGQSSTEPEFYRVYEKGAGIEKFDKFLERIGW